MKVAILVRVSSKSDRQDYDRQISDLKTIVMFYLFCGIFNNSLQAILPFIFY